MKQGKVLMNYSNAVDPYRTLALAVIHKAIEDTKRVKTSDEALEFIDLKNPDFAFWCDAAEVNPREIHALVAHRKYRKGRKVA